MTADKKLEILELSKSGVQLKDIAEKYEISISNVKKIVYSVNENQTYCLECGKIIEKSKFRPRKYCSAKCKREHYKKHPELLHKNKLEHERTSKYIKFINSFVHAVIMNF